MPFKQFPILMCGFVAATALYFALPFEPPIWPLPLAAAGILLSAWFARHKQSPVLFLCIAILASALAGFGWAQLRTQWLAQHYADIQFSHRQLLNFKAVIMWSEMQPRSSKFDVLVISDNISGNVSGSGKPYVLRLYGRHSHLINISPGCQIVGQAEMSGDDGPIVIGGFDPRRDAWFAGQRGQGFIRNIEAIDCAQPLRLAHYLARWRLKLAAHYREAMSKDAGPVAAALVTGVRGAIDKSVREAFRHSGLAHMLAISGLHMALFAGSIYALLRLLAACLPRLTLYRDTRKPSALASLAAATGYLLISGASVATQRAYIMMAIFFLAILLDRPAVTMRNVLWAMLLVLIWQPQAVMQVGFQMSFAAVMALVAVYEIWQQRDGLYLRWDEMSLLQQISRRAWRYASALFLTSLIAGSVTGFIAIVQFYRVGTFGLPANLLAMPLFGTLIMPMAPLSLFLMPFGLDGVAMSIMQRGIEWVLAVAEYFTGFERAIYMSGASPAFVLPLAAGGFALLVLGQNRWRLLGLLPILCAAVFIGRAEAPALHMFGRDLIVARDIDNRLVKLRQRSHSYELARIEAFHGSTAEAGNCRPSCRLQLSDGFILAYHDRPRGLSASCREAQLVIMPFYEARYPCAATLFDKQSFAAYRQRQLIVREHRLRTQKAASARLWQ